MLGITYIGIAFPLIFKLLPKRGNSNWEERKAIEERLIRLFGTTCIDYFVADREFIGKEWTGWLNIMRIPYYNGSDRISGLSNPHPERKSVHDGSSTILKSDRKSPCTDSFFTKENMSTLPAVGSETLTEYLNFRS